MENMIRLKEILISLINNPIIYIKCLKKIEIQDVEDFEERESDSNEDEFCPECNNYVGKKGSFIKNILISNKI